jgi:hypothetical protein
MNFLEQEKSTSLKRPISRMKATKSPKTRNRVISPLFQGLEFYTATCLFSNYINNSYRHSPACIKHYPHLEVEKIPSCSSYDTRSSPEEIALSEHPLNAHSDHPATLDNTPPPAGTSSSDHPRVQYHLQSHLHTLAAVHYR